MNSVKKIALNKISENGDINKNIKIEFETISILSKYQQFDSAYEKLIKIQDIENSPIEFLFAITNYFKEIEKNSNNEEIDTKKQFKNLTKSIKKSVEYIEKNIDDVYLLIFDENHFFNLLKNAKLLSFLEELSMILNRHELNTEADNLFMIKNKLELGFIRYFYNNEHKLLLENFNKEGEYKIADQNKIIETLNIYNFDNEFKKELIKNIDENKIFENKNTKNILNYLLLIKNIDKKKVNTKLKSLKEILKYFPEEISSRDDFNKHSNIINSINKKLELNYKIIEQNKEKITLKNLENQIVINLILEIML